MRAIVVALLALGLAAPAAASGVEGSDVLYVGGTIHNVKEGTVGRLDTTVAQALVFEYGGNRLEIPYSSMQRFQYTQKLARRLGVVATVAVVMVKHRQRRHFIEVYFRDAAGVSQVAVFEVAKDRAAPTVAVLNARVARAARPPLLP
jgi:hypothetical protein